MAKQNSATDPVSAAMSAIESALNLTDDDEAALASSENAAVPHLAPARPTTAVPVLKPSAPAGESALLLRPSAAAAPLDSGSKARHSRSRLQTTIARPSGPFCRR